MKLRLLYGAVLLATLLSGLGFYPITNEDAWISFKYARNLADGYGLVSNPEDNHQEGYSNLSLVLLLAASKALFNIDIVHAAKGIGLLSLLGLLLLTPAIVRLLLTAFTQSAVFLAESQREHLKRHDKAYFHGLSLLIMLSIGASQYLAWWATQGLETLLYAFTVWIILYLTLKVIVTQQPQSLYSIAFWSFISANTRPEGLMNFFVAGGLIFLSALLERRLFIIPYVLKSTALFLGGIIGILLFKACYFGDILANPTYVKLAIAGTGSPYTYLTDYLTVKGGAFTGLIIGACFGSVLSMLFLWHRTQLYIVITLILLSFLGSQLFFINYAGGDYMFYSRFIITHYPILILWIFWSILLACFIFFRQPKPYSLIGAPLLITGLLLWSASQEKLHLPRWYQLNFISPNKIHQAHHTGYHANVEKLSKVMTNEPGYYALSEFGYIPYHVAAKGLDIIGLNQSEIARNFKSYSMEEVFYANRDFILSKKPVQIILPRAYRIEDEHIYIDPAIDLFFRPYLESDFFKQYYDTDIFEMGGSQEAWIHGHWNGRFTSTHRIAVGDTAYYAQLMHGFYIEPTQIWSAPDARVLLKRRPQDKFINLEGYSPDLAAYPDQKNQLEIRINDAAVADKLFASQTLTQAGPFHFKVLLDDLLFREEDTLITLRGSQHTAPTDQRRLSYLFQAIYFSAE